MAFALLGEPYGQIPFLRQEEAHTGRSAGLTRSGRRGQRLRRGTGEYARLTLPMSDIEKLSIAPKETSCVRDRPQIYGLQVLRRNFLNGKRKITSEMLLLRNPVPPTPAPHLRSACGTYLGRV